MRYAVVLIVVGTLPLILFIVGYFSWKYIQFSNSGYRKSTGNRFWETLLNAGNAGEYFTFKVLEKSFPKSKLIVNAYIPRKGKDLTEVDLVMIHETGIYVFESKNYSGWIFGNEKHKNWTQSMSNRKKYKFFNPVWQNQVHINAIREHLNQFKPDIFKSYIVFSERCVLKDITIESSNLSIINRDNLLKELKRDIECSERVLTDKDIELIYCILEKFTLVDDETKKNHIENIIIKQGGSTNE